MEKEEMCLDLDVVNAWYIFVPPKWCVLSITIEAVMVKVTKYVYI